MTANEFRSTDREFFFHSLLKAALAGGKKIKADSMFVGKFITFFLCWQKCRMNFLKVIKNQWTVTWLMTGCKKKMKRWKVSLKLDRGILLRAKLLLNSSSTKLVESSGIPKTSKAGLGVLQFMRAPETNAPEHEFFTRAPSPAPMSS